MKEHGKQGVRDETKRAGDLRQRKAAHEGTPSSCVVSEETVIHPTKNDSES